MFLRVKVRIKRGQLDIRLINRDPLDLISPSVCCLKCSDYTLPMKKMKLTLTWSDICAMMAAMSGECRLMSEARRNISWARVQIRSHTDHGPFPSQTRSVNPTRWTGVLWLVTQCPYRSLIGPNFTLAPTYSHERGHPSSILYLLLTIIRVILIANLRKNTKWLDG